ncbi:FHA domain-containing protein [Fimbriimonas ginsengisoli Gsoil 348]|uniref:FHA domain-containing protein n=2 Tax=Fimbriimonas ginsengisoli TaxID=1005039 RepID=A0A068NKJ8_FIMGI|nr:FHA domain-containing protein [Fimbriimonas ginsengisoli Gsoil 348]
MLTGDLNRTQLGAPPTLDPNKTMMGTAPSLNATQTIKPTQCPVCKTFNPAGVMFCVDCGLIFDRALPPDAFGAPAVQLPFLVEQSGREHPLRPGTTVVGREGDIMISDGRASRRHAQLTQNEGAVTVEDLGSTNGTKVNGQALAQGERRSLNGGEKISFGGVEMQLALPGQKGGNTTQVFGSNKTAAISAPPVKEVPPAKLVGEGLSIPLRKGANIFGRKAESDVQISDPYVSGKHGLIEITDDGVYVTDTGSSNGTMLNDAKLVPNMRTQVQPDDVIRLGSKEFRVELATKK